MSLLLEPLPLECRRFFFFSLRLFFSFLLFFSFRRRFSFSLRFFSLRRFFLRGERARAMAGSWVRERRIQSSNRRAVAVGKHRFTGQPEYSNTPPPAPDSPAWRQALPLHPAEPKATHTTCPAPAPLLVAAV